MPRVVAFLILCAGCHSPREIAPAPRPPIVTPVVVAAPTPKLVASERACTAGDAWSCTVVGTYYKLGDDATHTPVDWHKAAGFLEVGCGADIPEACAMLAQMYRWGSPDFPADTDRAMKLQEHICELGVGPDCPRADASE